MDEAYFFDSYAIIEQFEGNPAYTPFKGAVIFTTMLNLFEIEYCYLKEPGEIEEFAQICGILEFDFSVVRKAVQLKRINKKLSLADCIGYCTALSHNLKFLTGDEEFKGMPNVEFVR